MPDRVRIVWWPSGTAPFTLDDVVHDELLIAVPVDANPTEVARRVETLLHEPDVVDLRQDFQAMGESLALLGQQVVESLDDDGRV
jgi:hypothetical protein